MMKHPLSRLGFGVLAIILPVIAVQVLGEAAGVGFIWIAFAQAAVALMAYLGFARWAERRVPEELLGPGILAELLAGLALGGVLFCLTIGSIWLLGGVEFDGWAEAPDLTFALGVAVMAGVVEELLVRGILFRNLEGWLGSWIALALSATIFGAMHLANPGASLATAVAIGLEAGVMLAAAYMVTGRLYLAIGMHAAWNFVQAGVFGVAVSGAEVGGLLASRPVGPDLISGGNFGAEASVLALLWCGALGVLLLWIAARRGRIMPLPMSGQKKRQT